MMADREGFVIIDEAPAVGMCFWQEKKVFDGTRVNEKTLEHHLDTLKDMYSRDKTTPVLSCGVWPTKLIPARTGPCPILKR